MRPRKPIVSLVISFAIVVPMNTLTPFGQPGDNEFHFLLEIVAVCIYEKHEG